MAGVRDAPLGRLQPEQAAEMRRRAHRTSEITPHIKGAQACGDRGRTAAGGAAGRALEVPWIAARAVQLRFGDGGAPELRCVRLAEYDEPGVLHPPDMQRDQQAFLDLQHHVDQLFLGELE